jgi:hypothetical protein
MRKLLLTVLALVMLSSSCLAANWEWAGSDEKIGMFYDVNSITFSISPNKQIVSRDRVWLWVKYVFDESFAEQVIKNRNVKFQICKVGYDFSQNKTFESKIITYHKDGHVLKEEPGRRAWVDIYPESVSDCIKSAVEKYVRAHEEEIEQRTRGAH